MPNRLFLGSGAIRCALILLATTAGSAPASARNPAGLVVSSGFGVRVDPLRHAIGVHRGVDLPGAPGTPILAAAAGIVRIAGWRGGYGILVEIEHPAGARTRYGHLSHASVPVGVYVAAGEAIGLMGATGRATGSHLHFEYRIGGVARDPLQYLSVATPPAMGIAPNVAGSIAPATAAALAHRSGYAAAVAGARSGDDDRLPDGRRAGAGLTPLPGSATSR